MAIKVCIVEDDDGIRESLAGLINGADGFQCVSGYANAEEALTDLPHKKPDVVLMDINLPKMSGVECVQALKAIDPNLQIVMLTVYDDEDLLFKS
jgi:DNA-binding NarL/FixJ family response regulator